jgi:hypothetical protein
LVFPACVAVRVHVPEPALMVTVLPLMVHAPDAAILTGNPELAVALAVNVLPYAALAGSVPKVMVWLAIVTVRFVVASLTGPYVASPAKLYVMG